MATNLSKNGYGLPLSFLPASFKPPIKKITHRVQEIISGAAPATVSVLRYNQRAVTVLSYVSQFASPPKDYKIEALAQRSLHSVLRLPPQTFARNLTNSIGFCTNVDPIPIRSYCTAVRFRFAISEAPYLYQLKQDVFALVGDSAPLSRFGNIMFHGGIDSPSILQCLEDTLAVFGPYVLPNISGVKVQSAVLRILGQTETCHENLESELKKKLRVSLGVHFDSVIFQPNWFGQIQKTFEKCNIFLRVCWLKAIGGAWTTSSRMHESIVHPCIFGCVDCCDEFRHYLICPILWQLAREALEIQEPSCAVGHRLCISSVSLDSLKLLGFAHLLYHSLRKDGDCFHSDGTVHPSVIVQRRAAGSFRALLPLVG